MNKRLTTKLDRRDLVGRIMRLGCAIAQALVVLPGAQRALAADHPGIAGDYVCTALCRPSDAPPSIAVVGDIATCMSELGGIYTGQLLNETSVACFSKTGTLAADGKTLRWSDGVVWERRSPHAD